MPSEAKIIGKKIGQPEKQDAIMRRVLYAKFSQNRKFGKSLLNLSDEQIIEKCNKAGCKPNFGKTLIDVRERLKGSTCGSGAILTNK